MIPIAIKGHSTRGKEVIELLELFGYVNYHKYSADCDSLCFYGGENTSTIYYDWVNNCEDMHIFALEEFLEKYPYKLNELVLCDDGLLGVITKMEWDGEKSDMKYHISFNTSDYNKWYNSKNIKCKFMAEKDMTNIAIKGHEAHGEDVIKILEMLGGINTYKYDGSNESSYYYIGATTNIIYCNSAPNIYPNIYKYTLEEFLEKYPYKVGDRVRIPEYESEVCINKMLWNGNEVLYEVVVDDEVERYSAEDLNEFNEPNKEETITIDDFKANTKEWLIDKLHDMVISKAIKTIGDIHEELHKPQYPKTYDECVNMFNCTVETVNLTTIAALRELIYCRNSYWKIAGEQMGLGKPWEPDWDNLSASHEFITINKGCFVYSSKVLVFPTKEMCDVFHENFKELIEKCKEFL